MTSPSPMNATQATSKDVFEKEAFCASPSSKSPDSFLDGKPPIALPSGLTTYLSFKKKNRADPKSIAIEAAKNPHLKAWISLMPARSLTSPTSGQISCPRNAPRLIPM